MTAIATAALPPRARVDPAALAVACGLGLLALVTDLVTGGDVAATLGVVLAAGLLCLIWVIPLRWSATALLVLGVTLEAPYEAFAFYAFRTPWNILGQMLLGNLNLTTHVAAMKFSGFDLLLVYLLIVQWVRRARGNEMDTRGTMPLARPLTISVNISLATMLVLWFWGIANGGSFLDSLLQVQKLVYAVLLMALLHGAYRGERDLRTLGYALVGSAMYRALLATIIHFTIRLPSGEHLPCSTTHADSRLFASAAVLLVVMINERVRHATHWTRLLALVTIVTGMVLNHRRLVWVSTIGALVLVALVSPWTPLKRRLARGAFVIAPVIMLYIAAGWNNTGSSVFKPVGTIRSVIDSKSDGSTMWRDLENMNLVRNISVHPFTGTGYGHEYIEYIVLPSVADAYPRFKFIPHNSLLALFVFLGPVGVAGMFSMLITTIFLAARTYRRSPRPAVRAAAMMSMVLIYLHLNQSYGDIGVIEWMTTFTLAPAMMIAGKLAIESGAWAWRPRRSSLQKLMRQRARVDLPESPPGWVAP